MKLINPGKVNARGLYLATTGTQGQRPAIKWDGQHPYKLLAAALRDQFFEIPDGAGLNEELVLYNRDCEEVGRKLPSLYVEPMKVGTIAEAIGLKDVIPVSGPVDVPLLGSLIKEEKGKWVGAGLGSPGKEGYLGAGLRVARALCFKQDVIPDDFHLGRTQLLFSGTIVFDPEIGICIPVLEKEGDKWIIRHRDILDQVIPGVDLHMWWW